MQLHRTELLSISISLFHCFCFANQLLRDTFIFKIVPMLNPDGVIVGNYRCSLAGRDLNRNYKTVLKDSYPSVWHTKNMIRKSVFHSVFATFSPYLFVLVPARVCILYFLVFLLSLFISVS